MKYDYRILAGRLALIVAPVLLGVAARWLSPADVEALRAPVVDALTILLAAGIGWAVDLWAFRNSQAAFLLGSDQPHDPDGYYRDALSGPSWQLHQRIADDEEEEA